MDKVLGRILRSDEVKLEGRVQLHAKHPRSAEGRPQDANAASAKQQVRILESHPEFAVIELTCRCGAKTYLRCEYAGAEQKMIGEE